MAKGEEIVAVTIEAEAEIEAAQMKKWMVVVINNRKEVAVAKECQTEKVVQVHISLKV